MDKKKTIMPKGKSNMRAQQRTFKQSDLMKVPSELEKEIKEAFKFFDPEGLDYISRANVRSIMGNFGFHTLNPSEIEEELVAVEYEQNQSNFSLQEVIDIIGRKWMSGGGKQLEGDELYKIFDKRDANSVGLKEIKSVFSQFLDFTIADEDIQEFITVCDLDKDGILNRNEFLTMMGYN